MQPVACFPHRNHSHQIQIQWLAHTWIPSSFHSSWKALIWQLACCWEQQRFVWAWGQETARSCSHHCLFIYLTRFVWAFVCLTRFVWAAWGQAWEPAKKQRGRWQQRFCPRRNTSRHSALTRFVWALYFYLTRFVWAWGQARTSQETARSVAAKVLRSHSQHR